jgi:hypothetical protein
LDISHFDEVSLSGRQTHTAIGENRPSRTCAFPSVFFKPINE